MTSLSATKPRVPRATPRIEYRRLATGDALPEDVLFAVHFGTGDSNLGARRARASFEPLLGAGLAETWHAHGPVIEGETGGVRFTHDDHFLVGLVEVPEETHDGIAQAAESAYRAIARFQAASAFPHLLRTWNYFDAINDGSGDAERYRGFCTGRVAGLSGFHQAQYPAATVIGQRGGRRRLQIYWLASREPGLALENPRQVSAFRYPREYGQTAPTFSRAMLVTPETLMISGTASIVGHASRHRGDVRAQVQEILANLDSLLMRARQHAPALPPRLDAQSLLKVYLRNADDLPAVEHVLRERLSPEAPLLILHGDVCRAELLVELDCVVRAPFSP
jgi:chorismate lyase/3-hydroxybenzoate synthase